ncbi:unnamed protein product [Candidula unifasciata]|uniref:Tudor domain-containing protein n=1 Tax=Candidula unifasciata TaxID=100452 RepID=A0A8S3ZW90_9EUPU|nr:unnamed protein product [Candidula unifasciata]
MADADHGYVLYQRGEEAESDIWDDTVLIKAYDSAVSAVKAQLAEQHPEFAAAHPGTKTKKKKRNKSKSKKKKSANRGTGKWKAGDLCRAVFTEDGEVYEARILSIDEDAETCTVKYIGYGNEEELPLSSLMPLVSEDSSQDVRTDTASDTGSVSHIPTVPEVNAGKHRNKKASSSQQHNSQNKRRMPKWPWDGYIPPPVFPQMPPQQVPTFQPPQFPGFPPPPAPHYPSYQAAGPAPPPVSHTSHAPPPMFPCVPPPPPLFTDQGEENEALYSMLISWYMSGYHTGYYQGLKHSASNTAAGHGIPR